VQQTKTLLANFSPLFESPVFVNSRMMEFFSFVDAMMKPLVLVLLRMHVDRASARSGCGNGQGK
jgi:hypothetical protein